MSSRLWLPAAIVVIWRIAAYWAPDEGPEGWIRVALAGLGLLFVACALLAWKRSEGKARLLFALYALCAGLHWGGPIGSSNLSANPLLLGLYIAVSSVLGQALFLHFALDFGPAWRSRLRRYVVVVLYVPVVVALSSVPILALFGTGRPAGELATSGLVLSMTVASFFAYVALLVFLLRVIRTKRRAPAAIVLVGALLGGLPYLLSTSLGLPGSTDVYNLFFALTPIAILVALDRSRDTPPG